MESIDFKMQKARIAMLIDMPFFGYLLTQLRSERQDGIQTMATDGRAIYYDGKFVEKLTVPQIKTILAHEVLHCAYKHMTRRQERNFEGWNIACDYVINEEIEKINEEYKSLNNPIPFPWPTEEQIGGKLYFNRKFMGLSSEEVYAKLPKKGSGKGNGKDRDGNDNIGSEIYEMPNIGQIRDAPKKEDESSKERKDKLDNEWTQHVATAANIAKRQGKLPGSLHKFIEELINPPKNWKDILREFFLNTLKEDYSFMRPNRRYISGGLILPSLKSEGMGPIYCAIDSSGSVDNRLFAEFLCEIEGILSETRCEKLVMMDADAGVHSIKEYEPGDSIEKERFGCGGTNFAPIFDKIEKDGEQPVCLIIFTDLDGSHWNKIPTYPVIWCAKEEDIARCGGRIPFGITIALK